MAGFSGRTFTFDWDSTELAGVQSRSLSVNNEYVDVTTDDDDGWRTLLATPGLRSVEVTISGIVSDEVLLGAIMSANIEGTPLTANLPTSLANGGTLAGDYLISSYETDGEHSGEVKFSVTFMSTGTITYTPSAAA